MIKEELKKIVEGNRAMRRQEKEKILKEQQEKQALKAEIKEKWREGRKSDIEERIERCIIESAKETYGDWIKVKDSCLTVHMWSMDKFYIYEITDEEVKAYCKKHKLKFRYWYQSEGESKDKFVYRYRASLIYNMGFFFKGYAIHI